MTAAVFYGHPWQLLLAAVLCYVGIVLYAFATAIRSVRIEPGSAMMVAFYIGFFPLPGAAQMVWFLQLLIVVSVTCGLGLLQFLFAAARRRAVLAHESGIAATPLPRRHIVLFAAPAAAILLFAVWSMIAKMAQEGDPWASSQVANYVASTRWAVECILPAVLALASYMALAAWLDRDWLRGLGRIRLLSADARFVWIDAALGLVSALVIAVLVAYGGLSSAGRFSTLAIMALVLLPGINQLSWIHDAILRGVITIHLMLAACAALMLGLHTALLRLAVPPNVAWGGTLLSVAGTAMILPRRVDRFLEQRLFPRASAMRARLLDIASALPAVATRAEAATALLERVVSVLDSEGGIVAVQATATEPASLHQIGSAEPEMLDGSTAAVCRYLAELTPGDGSIPRPIESLPFGDQSRLLRAGIIIVCPLSSHRLEATLLLGPRRGWLYDGATQQALRVFASQAALALENLALAQARAHAEKLAALGEAAARIAHEIRNPLAGARSLVQLAAEDGADPALAEPALGELDRIGRLVGDLLAFARRDDGLARTPVDLAEVCRRALEQNAALASDSAVTVESELASARVLGDAERLVQVVANLGRNGIEALRGRCAPRRLAIRTSIENGCAVIEVCDNGPGIAAEELQHIFEPFRTTKSAGTGLGLAIANRIVEAHGGHIRAESRAGAPTTFRVELPAMKPV
jgi:signal transduction histidine kinase